jgi:hypothetical protein
VSCPAAQAAVAAESAVDAGRAAGAHRGRAAWMDDEGPADLPPVPFEWISHRQTAERAARAAAERCAGCHRGMRGGRRGARQRRCMLRHSRRA